LRSLNMCGVSNPGAARQEEEWTARLQTTEAREKIGSARYLAESFKSGKQVAPSVVRRVLDDR